MNNYCVYMHISPSDKKYVGITCQNPNQRWRSGKGYKNQYFIRAIDKYGWDNFEHIIIAKGLDEETAKWLEIELIKVNDLTNPKKGYNITLGGEGVSGLKHTVETKRKISENHADVSGKNHPMYGKHLSIETKQKISKNNAHYWKGKHLSEETKQKLSGKNSPVAKSVICLTTKRIFFTATEGSNYYNITRSHINSCCGGKRKSCGKYNGQKLVWRYLNHKHNKTYRVKEGA